MQTGLAGIALPGLTWGAQPCPPPLLSASGGTSTNTGCDGGSAGTLPALSLVSGAGSGTHPWTFGQPFIKGAVTLGSIRAQSGASAFQADVRNVWEDGSVKFAVLSGISSFAGSSVNVVLGTSGMLTSGSAVAEPNVQASVQFSSPAVAVELSAARSNGQVAWSKSTPHRVRSIPGPVMSEFHYYAPVPGDAHLAVWWFVRAYSNGHVEVETVVENGWTLVASPGTRSYTATVNVGGTQRYSGALTQAHHTRWRRVDWISGAFVTPSHDRAYLQRSRLVPTYASVTLAPAAYDSPDDTGVLPMSAYTSAGVAYQATPFIQHGISSSMGSGGDKETYGPVPAWMAAYLVGGDARSYWCTVANSAATMRYSSHYRDEADGRPWRPSSRSALTANDSNAGVSELTGSSSDRTPAPTSPAAAAWSVTHSPGASFCAYLLSGRWPDLEEQQFQTGFEVLTTYSNYNNKRSIPFWMQNRGQGALFRDMVQANLITPTHLNGVAVSGAEAAQATSAQELVSTTVAQWYDWYVSGTSTSTPALRSRNNPFGLPYQNADFDFNGGSNADNEWAYGGLQTGLYITHVLYAFDAEPNVDATTTSRLSALAAFHAKFPTGLLGGDANGGNWDWRLSSFVNMGFGSPGATSNGGDATNPQSYRSSWNANWAQIQTAPAYNWASGTFPITQDNYLRKARTNGTNYALSVITEVTDDTDTRALWWCMHYAHKIADRVTVGGIESAYRRLTGSLTWTNTLANRAKVRPDYALVSDR